MWKKDERPEEFTTTSTVARAPQPTVSPPVPAEPRAAAAERATIGRSITVRGDVTGDEDLVIQGRVEGSVDLQQHAVTVGPDGEVIASIQGRVVTVEGRVEGNIDGGEQVTLRSSSFVKGDITAPRVVLENGARFRGLVDMGDDVSAVGTLKVERGGLRDAVTDVRTGGREDGRNGNAKASPSDGKPGGRDDARNADPKVAQASGADDGASKANGANGKAKRPAEAEPQLSV